MPASPLSTMRPGGLLTRKQIVDRALRKAGNTALSNGPTYEAQLQLNIILFDLYTEYPDWTFLNSETTTTINAETFTLPTDWMKSTEDQGLVVTSINGSAVYYPLKEVSPQQYQAYRLNGSADAYPLVWYPNRTDGTGRVYPIPTTNPVVATMRYQRLPNAFNTDPSDDSQIPAFPWHDYLIQALYTWTLEYEKDGRYMAERAETERRLTKFLKSGIPDRSMSPTLPLDNQVFKTPPRNIPNGGWSW